LSSDCYTDAERRSSSPELLPSNAGLFGTAAGGGRAGRRQCAIQGALSDATTCCRRHVQRCHIWLTPRWSEQRGVPERDDDTSESGPAPIRLITTRMSVPPKPAASTMRASKYTSTFAVDRSGSTSSASASPTTEAWHVARALGWKYRKFPFSARRRTSMRCPLTCAMAFPRFRAGAAADGHLRIPTSNRFRS